MTDTLHLAPKVSLPLEAVTETFGILAVRGAGKSNTAAVMAEEMFRVGLPFVVVDPVGSWWGLRSSRDGKGPGLPIPIFGGKHGDVPLERGGGQLVADLVVDQRLSCVLDLSEFDSEAAKKQFLLDFARRLYQRNTDPLHLFLEEADDYIPQRPMRDETHLLRAWENIVRRGRGRGLGMTLITQRSAAINKNVLTQVQTLIALRTTGPQDRAAIEEWVKYHDQSRDILASLSGLADGEAWIWSPRFLATTVRARFRQRATYDSGATPKFARGAKAPATLADVDLSAIQVKMAATIEKAKAEDPKALRQQIAELQRQVRTAAPVKAAPVPERIEVPALDAATLHRLEEASDRALQAVAEVRELHAEVRQTLEAARALASRAPVRAAVATRSADVAQLATRAPRRASPSGSPSDLAKGERAVLTAVAQYPDGVTRETLTVLTGYKRSSRDTFLQRLRSGGLVDMAGDRIQTTEAGLAALGDDFEPLPTGNALRDWWLSRLSGGERTILEALVTAYPKAVDRDRLGEMTGYQRSSRDTFLQKLKSRRLVDVSRGEVRASAELFS